MGIKESFHTSEECLEQPPGTSALRHAGEEKCCLCAMSALDPALLPTDRASAGHLTAMLAENTAPKDEQNPLRSWGGKETINFLA